MRSALSVLLMIIAAAVTVTGPARAKAPGPAWPAELADLPRTEIARHPLAQEGHAWRSELTGALQAAYHLNEGPYEGGPEAAARAFLAAWSGELGLIDPNDLRLARIQKAPGGYHVRFDQVAGGVPVWRADVVVSLDEQARHARAVECNYDPFLVSSRLGSVARSAEDAVAAAAAALRLPHDEGDPGVLRTALTDDPRCELWVVRDGDIPGGEAHLAYRVVLTSEAPAGEWTVRVDAASGEILGVQDTRVFVDGSGATFDPDPLTTAEVSYGGNYTDNSDADTAELNAERVSHTLRDLTYSGGVYSLVGPYCKLLDFESPSGAPVTSSDPNGFVFTRSQQGFEDVNVYYHIDNSQRHIQSLGFFDIQNGQIGCDPHGLSGQDNSHYLPASNRIAYGEGGVDDAEDADVIIHEYGHAIQHDIVSNWGGGEEGAMGEGFGDYWAGSHSASVSSFRENWVFNWDGHNSFWDGRILNSTMHYPDDMSGSVHSDGQIWSAPLFQSWHEIGREVMDRLVLKNHFYLGGSATMVQGAAAVMQADLDLYDGFHAGTLDWFFTRRGFFTTNTYIVPELVHIPLADTESAGPYPVVCTVTSSVPLVTGSVRVVYGVGGGFTGEADLSPTGNPNEYAGAIPDLGSDVEVCYYIKAKNTSGWWGTHPRGAEHSRHDFHVAGFSAAPEPEGALAMNIHPNPAAASGVIAFVLPQAGEVSLSIFDPSGRVVRTLQAGSLPAGAHALAWDGRTAMGEPASPGIYFARLQAGPLARVEKLVLTR